MTATPYDPFTRLIHLLLAALGIAALLTGDGAGDYRRASHPGFTLHSWIGLSMAFALGLRLFWGIAGPAEVRFATWVPATASRLRLALEDIGALARLRLPARVGHEGLAGVVQATGLLAFLWLAITGGLMFAYLEPGTRATGWLRAVKELHEGAEPVAIAYLVLHVGAVLVHAVAGHPVWRRMLPWPRRE